MKATVINNEERIFWLKAKGVSTKNVICNLKDVPDILRTFGEGEEIEVRHLWDNEFKRVSRKYLIDMFESNRVDFKKVYVFSFEGREKGAIGKAYMMRGVKVVANNRGDAELKLYDSFDHIIKLACKIKY